MPTQLQLRCDLRPDFWGSNNARGLLSAVGSDLILSHHVSGNLFDSAFIVIWPLGPVQRRKQKTFPSSIRYAKRSTCYVGGSVIMTWYRPIARVSSPQSGLHTYKSLPLPQLPAEA